MRIFIIGSAETIWMKEYIKNIHLEKNREVFLTAYEPLSKDYEDEYAKLGVSILQLGKSNTRGAKIIKLIKLIAFAMKHKFYKKFDVLDIQGPPHSSQAFVLACIARFLNVKTVTSFWGSDILCLDANDAWKLKRIIDISDVINISTPEMLKKFSQHFEGKYRGKILGAKFGSLAFSSIDSIKAIYNKDQCKEFFDIDNQKITIAVGYNGRREQQHIPALMSLKKICNEIKKDLFLIIHMGYNLEDDYYADVKKEADACGIDYKIITTSFDLDNVALLRMATDIFLHAQTSDALSGSIRECIYAEAILLNPCWIQYSEYDNKGVEYITYSSFEEIASIIENIVKNDIRIDTKRNAEIVGNSFSWNAVRKDWELIFNDRSS